METIVQIFEPWLLKSVDIDEFNGVRTFLDEKVRKYTDLDEVQTMIKENVSQKLPDVEKMALIADVDKASSVMQAMELYLGFLGKGSFNRIFPS
jgi:hypothetical protein